MIDVEVGADRGILGQVYFIILLTPCQHYGLMLDIINGPLERMVLHERII